MDHSPIASGSTSTQQSQQFVNYYPAYVPRQAGQAPQQQGTQPPYPTQIDANGQQQWPPAMAAAAAMAAMAANDPMAIAAYMNGPNGVQNGAPYPPGNPAEMTQQHYDQFSFGFTPAFGFGYAGNGSIDYAAIQAAQQQHGSTLNPQSNQWTPSNPAVPATASATSNNPTNPSLSPANTTTSSNDTTPSVPSTTASDSSAANQSKWVQVMQDPHAVHEFNTFQPQQLSPGDMYMPQHHPHQQPHHNYRSHHHYQRHQHMQSNYHHYQYNNPYHMPHYQGQYNMQPHQMQHHHYGQKNYNNNNYNKSNNYHNNNNNNNNNNDTGNYHDDNNNSNKSNNLNSDDDKEKLEMCDEANTSGTDANESKSDSGSKSWASIVGVSSIKPSGSNTPQAAVSSPPTMQQNTNNDAQLTYPAPYQQQQQQQQQQPMLHEHTNYMKPKNNYYKNNYKQNNYDSSNQQQIFDLTNRSFPPIGDNCKLLKMDPYTL